MNLNSHSLIMTFRHKAFIKIMKFVRDYIFECLRYSQDSNMESNKNNNEITTSDAQTSFSNIGATLMGQSKRDTGLEVIKLFSCSNQLSVKF